MKRLLIKLAHKIINKYDCGIDIKLGSTIMVNEICFVVNKMVFSKEYFKNDLIIEASDIIPFKNKIEK